MREVLFCRDVYGLLAKHPQISTADVLSQMIGLSTSDRRDEGGLYLFHTLSLKGVGGQVA